MTFAQKCNTIFDQAVTQYHMADDVDAPVNNPYPQGGIEHKLFAKCSIDAIQWHLEDIIRSTEIDPAYALSIKRRIDRSNQERTDMVEEIDCCFREEYRDVKPLPEATINTESPAWALDRLSILALKIYHMLLETTRPDATPEHIAKCRAKLEILLEQRQDLTTAIDQLLDDISCGRKYMKTYRQMKMYNDPETNPVLYGNKHE